MTDEGQNNRKKFWIGLGAAGALTILIAVILRSATAPMTATPRIDENANNARMTILAIKAYASDHDGNYPPTDAESGTLLVLFPYYIDVDYPLYWVHPKTKEKIPWLYNPGLSEGSYSRTPLIVQPVSYEGKRIVGYTGGQVITEREDSDAPFQWPPKPVEPPSADP